MAEADTLAGMPWPKLAFETARSGDQVSLTLTGELDLATGPSLEQAVAALLPDGLGALLLDLHGLTFCDSSGIASLIRVQRAVAAAGGSMELHRVDSRVRRVLDIGGVSELLGVADSPAESS